MTVVVVDGHRIAEGSPIAVGHPREPGDQSPGQVLPVRAAVHQLLQLRRRQLGEPTIDLDGADRYRAPRARHI